MIKIILKQKNKKFIKKKGALAAAFKLFSPENFFGPMLNLAPVVSSSLAQRRANKINSINI
jgi:hypothetical protein